MSKMYIAYKYRLYPTDVQVEKIIKTFECCQMIYNLMLEDKIAYYKETGKMLLNTPAQYKKEHPVLKEVDSLALMKEYQHLDTAYQNFFSDRRMGFPKFKAQKQCNSYTTRCVNNNIRLSANAIRLPKIGFVKAKIHRIAPDDYKLISVTVSRVKSSLFYASFQYEYEQEINPVEHITSHIGLDYKTSGLYMDSLGNCPNMPHFYCKAQEKLAKEQRKLSKMVKGSNNYSKQKQKIARLFSHVTNQRRDYLHKLSAELTNQYDLISAEDLDFSAISQYYNLGKATNDNAYATFLKMVEYKQHRKGHHFVKVDRYYPSSQLCQCGYRNPISKDLSVREITCPMCGRTYDRDQNAAINIDAEGYRIYLEKLMTD